MSGRGKDYFSRATVTLQIRVSSKGHWGKDATVEEVMRIGSRETVNAITTALAQSSLKWEMIGEPEVGAITWEIAK